jgi:hypothetical protein
LEILEKCVAELVEASAAKLFIAGSEPEVFNGFEGKLVVEALGAFDGDFPVAEVFVGENFGLFGFFETEVPDWK